MSLVGQEFGNYRVTRLLGEGGMGAVYLGEHPLIGKRVAIKVLHEDLASKEEIVSRFFTEAKAVNAIQHENIVDIVDFGRRARSLGNGHGPDTVYLIMEFLDGESLSARLKRPLASPDAVQIIIQAASALQASHALGIIHRDLKPENIYLVRRGTDPAFVKLLDFGIAKLTGSTAVSSRTALGSVLGTPSYMSPEQCDGRGNIDHRSDIYSLGMVLYELVTGRVAFAGEGFGEILVAHLTQAPPPPSTFRADVPPGLESIIMRCLEKDRSLRFQSMDELRAALEHSGSYVAPRRPRLPTGTTAERVFSLADDPTVIGMARPTTLSHSSGEVGNRQGAGAEPGRGGGGLVAATLALLAAVFAGGGFWYFKMRPSPPPEVPQTALQPRAPEKVMVHIDSSPAGARVMRAGVKDPIGVTPFELQMARGEAAFEIVVEHDHYKPQTHSITTDRDRDVTVSLEKIAVVVAPPPQTPRVSRPRVGHSPSRSIAHPDSVIAPIKQDPDGVLAPNLDGPPTVVKKKSK